jgi:formylglycine-generating enzyme required for sulfatase activity
MACPATGVTWYEAAAYCNWLSEQEGIAKEQWCYLKNAIGKYEVGMRMAPDYLKRTGYRLPTEAEWEYACRVGAETAFSCGEADDLLGKYAWFIGNSLGKHQPVGRLKPNDLGLFDMHGNALEWTQDVYTAHVKNALEWAQDVYTAYVEAEDGKAIRTTDDPELAGRDRLDINDRDSRVLRGGSFDDRPVHVRSADRDRVMPSVRYKVVGFRPARTFR